MAGNHTALSNFKMKTVRDNLTLLYATNWAGITQAAPSGVGGTNAVRFPDYAASTTSRSIPSVGATIALTLTVDKAFTANTDYVRANSVSDPTKYVDGLVTAYGSGAITITAQYVGGSGSVNDWTIGGTIPAGRHYFGDIKFVGTDTETDFALPVGSPFYATVSTSFGIQFIDWIDGFASDDAAGFAGSASTDFEQVTIRGVTTTALVIDQKQPTANIDNTNGYRKQTWAMFYCDTALSNAFPRMLIRYDLWINDLTGKFSSTNRRVNICEMKTVTDHRYVITIIYADATDAAEFGVAVGTIGWEIISDNRANVLTAEEFFRYKNFTVPVPTEEFFKFEVYWQRPTSHADVTTGRLLVQYTLESDTEPTVVCDYHSVTNAAYNAMHPLAAVGNNPDTNNVNVHNGVDIGTNNGKPQRIFFFGVYGKYERTNMMLKCANAEFWNGGPLELGNIPTENIGPLTFVPTPLARATHYASYGGIGSSPGTYSNPMSLDTIIGSAVAGNVVFIRGGTINATAKYRFNGNNGTAGNPIIFEVYPGETLTIDGSTGVPGVDDWCGRLQSSFTYLRGDMRFINMPAQGLLIDGSDNILDGVSATGNHLSGAEVYEASGLACRNTFINGIYTDNSDVGYSLGGLADGNNADGITISNGTGNKVQHCTLLRNSDDGVDTARSINSVVEYCISGLNGLGAGDGNGIKAGLASTGSGTIVRYNLAYSNRAAGIDSNTVIAGVFSSNTTYGNGTYGYIFESDTVATRNVSSGDAAVHGATTGTMTRNSWDISGTLTLVSTNPASSDFLKVTQDGTFNGIGAHYL